MTLTQADRTSKPTPPTEPTAPLPGQPAANGDGDWDGLTRQELLSWFQARGQTLGALAMATGRAKGGLSDWFNGKYPGDCQTIGGDLLKVKRLMDERDAQPASARAVYVETSIAKEIWTVLRVARLDRDLALVTSLPGRGKTTAAMEYASRYPRVIYLDCDDTTNVCTIARWLCGALHVPDSVGQLDVTMDRLCAVLKGTDTQIIVDQAEFLLKIHAGTIRSIKGIEFLRSLYDRTHISVAMLALPRFYHELRRRPEAAAYIMSRIGIRREIGMPTDDDVALWANAHGITDAGAIRELCARKGAEGHLRTVRNAAFKALRMASVNHVPVTAAVIQEAFKYVYA